jgi:hypothetical protein
MHACRSVRVSAGATKMRPTLGGPSNAGGAQHAHAQRFARIRREGPFPVWLRGPYPRTGRAGSRLHPPYHQFKDKEELALAVLDWVDETWRQDVGSLVDEEPDPVVALIALPAATPSSVGETSPGWPWRYGSSSAVGITPSGATSTGFPQVSSSAAPASSAPAAGAGRSQPAHRRESLRSVSSAPWKARSSNSPARRRMTSC